MKKILIIIIILLAGFATYYFITPKQTRLDDNYPPNTNVVEQTEDADFGIDTESERTEDILIYYFSKDDSDCSGELTGITIPDMDNRYAFEEINALVTLLLHEAPDEYKSAIFTNTVLNQLTIRKGIAYVDVSQFISIGKDGSCGLQARYKQIDTTLKQFDGINEVKLLQDGKELAL